MAGVFLFAVTVLGSEYSGGPVNRHVAVLTVHRKHLWKDLRPWICHDATCQFGDEPFSSQEDWVQHLSLDHGMGGDWKPIECPLCFELTGEGKSAITRHLAVHMEEISLAALPNRGDSEDGSNAGDDADSAIEDRASSIGSEETGRQNDLGPEHEHVQLGSEETVRIISSMMAVHDRLNEALYQNRSLESLKAVALTAEDLIEVTTERISMGSRHTASNADLMHLESRLQGIRALAEQARLVSVLCGQMTAAANRMYLTDLGPETLRLRAKHRRVVCPISITVLGRGIRLATTSHHRIKQT